MGKKAAIQQQIGRDPVTSMVRMFLQKIDMDSPAYVSIFGTLVIGLKVQMANIVRFLNDINKNYELGTTDEL